MARFRKISLRMWGDDKFRRLSPLPPSGQSLWIWLICGPYTTNLPGILVGGEAGMAERLGWPLEAFREAFREASAQGLVKADWKARFVWVPNAIRHNPPESPNVVKGWREGWEEAPECDLKREAYSALKVFTEGMSEGFQEAFREAIRKPLANQEQEQEQEQELFRADARASDAGQPGSVKPTDRPADDTKREPGSKSTGKTKGKTESKPKATPEELAVERADCDAFLACYRNLWRSPDASLASGQFMAYRSLRRRHGAPQLLAWLKAIGNAPDNHRFWTLGRCVSGDLADVGGRLLHVGAPPPAPAGPPPKKLPPPPGMRWSADGQALEAEPIKPPSAESVRVAREAMRGLHLDDAPAAGAA